MFLMILGLTAAHSTHGNVFLEFLFETTGKTLNLATFSKYVTEGVVMVENVG